MSPSRQSQNIRERFLPSLKHALPRPEHFSPFRQKISGAIAAALLAACSPDQPQSSDGRACFPVSQGEVSKDGALVGVEKDAAVVPGGEYKASPIDQKEIGKTCEFLSTYSHHQWDDIPEFFEFYKNGDFTPDQRRDRYKTLGSDVRIFQDVGVLQFYVVRDGETLSGINKKLSKHYPYLSDQRDFLHGFNIRRPKKNLKPEMLIPIPLKNENRHLTDEQFLGYSDQAIHAIQENPKYGPVFAPFVESHREEELLTAMLAIAKQESGGKPLGQFEFHRWEPKYHAFSFSLFHVLMRDAGFLARCNLNMTEGQLYHPRNAGMLMLAFLVEKITIMERARLDRQPSNQEIRERVAGFFPMDQHYGEWAYMYNGSGWKKRNRNYVRNLTRYHDEASVLLHALATSESIVAVLEPSDRVVGGGGLLPRTVNVPVQPTTHLSSSAVKVLTEKEKTGPPKKVVIPSSPKVERHPDEVLIGKGRNLFQVLQDANWERGKGKICLTDACLFVFMKPTTRFLRAQFGSDTYFPSDSVRFEGSPDKPVLIFKRGGKEYRIRLVH